jgi:hypothetical protein
MRFTLLLTTSLLPLLPCPVVAQSQPQSARLSVKQVVRRHLEWVAATRNYKAQLTVEEAGETHTATVLVDYMTDKTVVLSAQPTLPPGVFMKATKLPDRTLRISMSRGLARSDDLAVSEKVLPPGPYEGGSYSAFLRGAGLNDTLDRLNVVASGLEVLPPSDLGEYGLKMTLRRDFMAEMASVMDEFFGVEDQGYPAAVVMWLGEDGRTTAVENLNDRTEVTRTTVLEYEDRNLSTAALAPIIAAATASPPPQVQPSTPVREATPEVPGEEVAETVLNSWALVLLSVVMVIFCVVLVIRLRNTPDD